MVATVRPTLGFLTVFDRIIPATVRERPNEWQAARHLALLAAITAVSAPLLTLMYHFLGFDAAGMVVLTGGIAMMVAPFALNAGLGLPLARDLFVGALYLLKVWLALHLGGLSAPTVPWFLLCPVVALLLGGLRPGLAWCGLVSLTVLALFALGRAGAIAPAHAVADEGVLELVSIIGLVALATIIGALAAGSPERRAR